MSAENSETLLQWLIHDAAGFFTAVLVFVGVVQLVLFIWQLRLIRTSLDDAKISADAAADAAKAASRQAHVAEETLARIERPYLYVIKVERITVVDETMIFEDGRKWLDVEYSIVNHGKIPAIIEEPRAGLSVSSEPQRPDRLEFSDSLVIDPILAPGDVRLQSERLEWTAFTATEDDPHAPYFGENQLWFWVVIPYRGPFSQGHEIRKCWRYDKDSFRFIGPWGNTHYSNEK
jgi:hypothetical protein